MTDQRRAYTLKCLCGFTRKNHIGRPPKVCPQCGAKPEPDGLNRAMRRKLAREMRKSKGLVTTVGPSGKAYEVPVLCGIENGQRPPMSIEQAEACYDIMQKNGMTGGTFINTPRELFNAGVIDLEQARKLDPSIGSPDDKLRGEYSPGDAA